MSKIVGIICEYNPFHKGHKYQIDKIKELIPECKIVAIMSGNSTQRGELSIIDKYKRAEIALEMGVDLVTEIPFPYSSSTAEIFACAGVEIAMQLSCNTLAFGTENCDLEYLKSLADAIDSVKLEDAIKKELQDKSVSYIVAKERALSKLGFNNVLFANDMLATEYLRAIRKKGANIMPIAVKRTGAGYNDNSECEIMSAGAIREKFIKTGNLIGVPEDAQSHYEKSIEEKSLLDFEKSKDFIYRTALIIPKESIEGAFDSSKEIASIIKSVANDSKNGSEFYENLSTKNYTRARLSRVILYAIYSIKSIDKSPKFTILLGANEKGREIISKSKKSEIKIITKHSDSAILDKESTVLLEKGYELDKMHASLLLNPMDLSMVYKRKPIIK
ncbi:MAG: nucleotidyltransferase family protein [Clostridia bacterium]|nr:nucleotidyltransferase family protein [Clostridia bacterium]